MQQPLEERVASLETASARHDQTIARLTAIAENQDQLLERLMVNQEIFAAKQETFAATQETFAATLQTIVQLLEELTRDAATTRRLWLRLAQRYGWLDDEQNGAQPQDPT